MTNSILFSGSPCTIFIFIETVNIPNKAIVGEIYRIPNSNTGVSLERYDTILSKLSNSHNVIIGSDLNFDFLKTETHIHM